MNTLRDKYREILQKVANDNCNYDEVYEGFVPPEYIEAHSDKDIAYNQALSDIKALLGGK